MITRIDAFLLIPAVDKDAIIDDSIPFDSIDSNCRESKDIEIDYRMKPSVQ